MAEANFPDVEQAYSAANIRVIRSMAEVQERPGLYTGKLNDGLGWLTLIGYGLDFADREIKRRIGQERTTIFLDSTLRSKSCDFSFYWNRSKDGDPSISEKYLQDRIESIQDCGVLNALSAKLVIRCVMNSNNFEYVYQRGILISKSCGAANDELPYATNEAISFSAEPGEFFGTELPEYALWRGYLLRFSHERPGVLLRLFNSISEVMSEHSSESLYD